MGNRLKAHQGGTIAEGPNHGPIYINILGMLATYDHRLRRIGHPVRSAIHKPQIGRLVVGWVTTSEYLLLYVFFF
jgi:hypothetical protein